MPDLLPRLAVAAYCIALIAFLLWQGIRGLARLRAVIDYLEFRERRHPEAKAWRTPLPRDATLPFGALALVGAGVAIIPLLLGVVNGRVTTFQAVLGGVSVVAAATVIALMKRSPWSETRGILWEAAGASLEVRSELLEEALETDPQLHGRVERQEDGPGGGLSAPGREATGGKDEGPAG